MFKKTTSRLALLAFAFCFSNSALAGLHVEPFLGYSLSGDYEQGSADGDYTSDGPQLGLRLGYGMLGFFGALEYELSPMTAEPSGSGSDTGIDQTNLGLSVGYEFPILVRAYATYIFDATGEADSSGDPEYTGTGTKFGIGYTGLPFIAINFEMTTITYDEVNGNSLTNDLEATYYTINVSAPFNF